MLWKWYMKDAGLSQFALRFAFFLLLNDPACEKCFSSHRLHMCTSSWPGSTTKSHCFLSAALNCSMWRSRLRVDGAACRGGKGLMRAAADWGQMIYLIKTICQKAQHGNRGGHSPCESRDLLIRCQAKSWTALLLQPLSNSLLMVYFWITATIKFGGNLASLCFAAFLLKETVIHR